MYAGRAVEYGPASEVFASPQHPHTWGLLSSMPRWDRQRLQRLAGSAEHLVACHLSDERRQHILDDEIRPKL
jgi:ABC-type dipeptide/oligopeptide/nickel transport system ATPase component